MTAAATIDDHRKPAGRSKLRPRRLAQRLRQIWNPEQHVQATLDSIRRQHAELKDLATHSLQDATNDLKARQQHLNTDIDLDTTIAAFALMTEAVRRTTGMEYYDVQLRGGLALVNGQIAQMQTGEGKTLTTGLPAFALGLAGKGVHVATTNSYLAARDSEELRPALEMLGFTVGLLPEEHDPTVAKGSYQSDVTFGTGYDFGFDFLRDQISLRRQPKLPLGIRHLARLTNCEPQAPQLLQRPHAFAIVDEADSVLIDEATMPLILSVPTPQAEAPHLLQLAKNTAEQLVLDQHFTLNEAQRTIEFTNEGWTAIHLPLQQQQVCGLQRPWSNYVQQALRASTFLQRDVDYVVTEEEVHIVDQQTGRIHEERSWRDGLHQAVEIKEGLPPSPEKSSEGRVSRQRYFQLYDQLCGMTGTAAGSGPELADFYGLNVTEIPTHRPCRRETQPTRCFKNDEARDVAVVNDALRRQKNGQPVLIGTRTIKHSKRLANRMQAIGANHTVLNGVQDQTEASIIGSAGAAGAITIATNMAGRGTDIKPDAQALKAGGLHVMAVEHNASPRVDRQLAGRAARQGQPGSVQFFVSADDEIFVQGESRLPKLIREASSEGGECLQTFASDIADLQRQLEARDFERRREMVQRDQWLDSVLETLAGRGESE